LSTTTRILFVNHTGIVSGAERVLLLILDHLNRDLFEPVVICPEDGPLAELVRERQVPVVAIPSLSARFTWNPFRLVNYLHSYAKVIRAVRNIRHQNKIDLIHANSVRAGLLATFASAGTGIPVIWHLHDMMKHHPLSTTIRWVVTVMPPVLVLGVSRAAAEQFRGWLLRLTGRARIAVLHNPVDSQQFRPDLDERKHTRELLGLRDEQFAFAVVGQITPRKGQLGTIEAFSEVALNVPNAVLFVVGAPLFNQDHEYLENLKSAATRLDLTDRVLFLGQRNDVNALLGAVDGVVVNSRREPFGLIVLEALAAGKPIVATRVDGIPELIEDKVTGLLTVPGDRQALASALRTLCSDPDLCQKLSSKGRALVEKAFDCSNYVRTLETLYDKSVKRSVAGPQQSYSRT
jgi:L-malate glycosyltransferase